jgi:hypothetical protein
MICSSATAISPFTSQVTVMVKVARQRLAHIKLDYTMG